MTQLELPSSAPGISEPTPDVSTVPSPIEGEEESHTPKNTQNNAEMPEEEDISSNSGWSIAVSKGVRNFTQTMPYPVSNYVSYTWMSPEYNRVIQTLMTISVPKNVQEAISSNEWRKAMDEEMEALEKNGTWEMGPLPVGKKLVGSRWVFTIKYHFDGSVARYKARLVARGYTQAYGIDYNKTFAPVAKLNTIQILIALAALSDWKLFQFDVKNAFLHGELEEEVYMAPPLGYFLKKNNTSDVCHLRKSIYGLKQSPRAWFRKFSKTMLSTGYAQSEGDHTLFIKHGKEVKLAILIVYVDDIVVTGNDVAEIQNLKKHLASLFDIKALGLLSYFLGIEVAYSASGIVLSQHKYIIDVLKDRGKLDCRPAVTPVDVNVKLKAKQHEKDFPVNKTSFQRLIGRLLYLNHTRPDLAVAVNSLSQFMNDSRESHQGAADRILAYLKGSIGQGSLFKKGSEPSIVIYIDSDYAGSSDDSRSTSGYCSFIGGNLITWSKKQKEVSLSSAESELRAIKKGVSEGMWIKDILQDLCLLPSEGMTLYLDSKSAIAMAKNPVQHERTKHAWVAWHYIKQSIEEGFIIPQYTPSLEQVADIFTKGIPGSQFLALVSKLGMIDIYTQLAGEC